MTISHLLIMKPAPHPSAYYIAHRFHPKHGWGALTDGPEDLHQLLDRIADWSRGAGPDVAPDLGTLLVWRFQADVPPRIVTEDVLAMAFADEVAA